MGNVDGMAYVARKKCGCICGAIVDDPSMARDIELALVSWVRERLTIDRVSNDVVRAEFVGWNCPHEPKQLTLQMAMEQDEA